VVFAELNQHKSYLLLSEVTDQQACRLWLRCTF